VEKKGNGKASGKVEREMMGVVGSVVTTEKQLYVCHPEFGINVQDKPKVPSPPPPPPTHPKKSENALADGERLC